MKGQVSGVVSRHLHITASYVCFKAQAWEILVKALRDKFKNVSSFKVSHRPGSLDSTSCYNQAVLSSHSTRSFIPSPLLSETPSTFYFEIRSG